MSKRLTKRGHSLGSIANPVNSTKPSFKHKANLVYSKTQSTRADLPKLRPWNEWGNQQILPLLLAALMRRWTIAHPPPTQPPTARVPWSSGEGGVNGEEDCNWERFVASARDKGRTRAQGSFHVCATSWQGDMARSGQPRRTNWKKNLSNEQVSKN